MTGYQDNHRRDETKQAQSPLAPEYHWSHFQPTSQCLAPAWQPPHFGLYSYVNPWPGHALSPSVPIYHAPLPHPRQQPHPGAAYPQHSPYSAPLYPIQYLPAYLPLPNTSSQQPAYKQPRSHGPKFRQYNAQSYQHQFGPPQKPLQSRHALWVGGIPTETHVEALRDHFFTPETAADILSVVFMPQSHSGFVNFRTARSCKAAAHRFNNSHMTNAFLRCRCRRPSSEVDTSTSPDETASSPSTSQSDSASSPSTPQSDSASSPSTSQSNSASSPGTSQSDSAPVSAAESDFSFQLSDEGPAVSSSASTSSNPPVEQVLDDLHQSTEPKMHPSVHQTSSPLEDDHTTCRYFLLKSLTPEELVASVNSGRWATQSQNETALSEAYQTCDAVYLIFSVNRSGEFFGYARMTSQIKDEAAAVSTKQQVAATNDQSKTFSSSKSYQTPAKGLIPEGRVVDELYRGKIFWELCSGADSAPREDAEPDHDSNTPISSFKIEWISIRKLPFWQTKHLQNSWNDDKPVKVGRDGTELETEVGRRLCHLVLSPPARKSASAIVT